MDVNFLFNARHCECYLGYRVFLYSDKYIWVLFWDIAELLGHSSFKWGDLFFFLVGWTTAVVSLGTIVLLFWSKTLLSTVPSAPHTLAFPPCLVGTVLLLTLGELWLCPSAASWVLPGLWGICTLWLGLCRVLEGARCRALESSTLSSPLVSLTAWSDTDSTRSGQGAL